MVVMILPLTLRTKARVVLISRALKRSGVGGASSSQVKKERCHVLTVTAACRHLWQIGCFPHRHADKTHTSGRHTFGSPPSQYFPHVNTAHVKTILSGKTTPVPLSPYSPLLQHSQVIECNGWRSYGALSGITKRGLRKNSSGKDAVPSLPGPSKPQSTVSRRPPSLCLVIALIK